MPNRTVNTTALRPPASARMVGAGLQDGDLEVVRSSLPSGPRRFLGALTLRSASLAIPIARRRARSERSPSALAWSRYPRATSSPCSPICEAVGRRRHCPCDVKRAFPLSLLVKVVPPFSSFIGSPHFRQVTYAVLLASVKSPALVQRSGVPVMLRLVVLAPHKAAMRDSMNAGTKRRVQ